MIDSKYKGQFGKEVEALPETTLTAISNLKSETVNFEGKSIEVLGYYAKGDGGGGLFYWDAASTEADNGGTIIQATAITAGRWKRVFSGSIFMKWFGASELNADNYQQCQDALTYIGINGGELFIDAMYKISQPLNVNRVGAYFALKGNYVEGKSGFSSTVAMDYILTVGTYQAAFQGRFNIEGITFDCNDNSGGINLSNTTYSNFEKNKIHKLGFEKIAIKAGSWANRIINNSIKGVDNSATGIFLTFNSKVNANQVNHMIISENSLTTLKYGVTHGEGANGEAIILNGVSIIDNTFDFISAAALFLKNYTAGLSFRNNYLERCGSDPVPVKTSDTAFENRYGTIVLGKRHNSPRGYAGLSIKENFFFNCMDYAPIGKRSLISAEGVVDGVIEDNAISISGVKYDGFVSIDGVGQYYSEGAKFNISQGDPNDMFTELVIDNRTNEAFPSVFGQFSANWGRKSRNIASIPNLLRDISLLTTTGQISSTTTKENGITKSKIVKTNDGSILLDLTETSGLLEFVKGKYLRISGRQYAATSNSLRVLFKVDTGNGLELISTTTENTTGFFNVTRSNVYAIPLNAISVRFEFTLLNIGEVDVYGLDLFDTARGYV